MTTESQSEDFFNQNYSRGKYLHFQVEMMINFSPIDDLIKKSRRKIKKRQDLYYRLSGYIAIYHRMAKGNLQINLNKPRHLHHAHCLDLNLNCKRPGVTTDGNFSSYLIGRS